MSKIITSPFDVNISKVRRERNEATTKARNEHARQEAIMVELKDPENIKYKFKDQQVANMFGLELVRHYPGHGWNVESDIRNGIVKIFNNHVTSKAGWVFKLKEFDSASFSVVIKRIGGEMLERSGLNRGAFNEIEIMEMQTKVLLTDKVDLS